MQEDRVDLSGAALRSESTDSMVRILFRLGKDFYLLREEEGFSVGFMHYDAFFTARKFFKYCAVTAAWKNLGFRELASSKSALWIF